MTVGQQPNNPPPDYIPGVPTVTRPPIPREGVQAASSLGDGVEPFLVGGSFPVFIVIDEEGFEFDPRPEGIQLLCSIFIPPGRVGFVKQIRVGPYIPPVLADPWATAGVAGFQGSWRAYDDFEEDGPRPGGTNGYYTTPMGWRSYFDVTIPEWHWHLRYQAGDVVTALNFNGFNPSDQKTWAYLPEVPVPREAYTSRGLPGFPPARSMGWGPNAIQCTPEAPLFTHALIPENTTLMLFATWKQDPILPRGQDDQGVINYAGLDDPDNRVYPLLPSYGQLNGYMQSAASAAAQQNARDGWGG